MVEWGNYAEAYKAIHDKLEEILAKLDYPSDPAVQDIIDRADRLLGRVYGSQGQQLKQRASTYELMVQLVHQGEEYQAGGGAGGLVQCQIRNAGDTAWINEPFTRDISDRAARDLGKVDIAGFDVPLPAGINTIGAIIPSGDMARKDYYDRNALSQNQWWFGTVSAGSSNWIQKWGYTVPTGKKCVTSVIMGYIDQLIATSDRTCAVMIQVAPGGGTERMFYGLFMVYGDPKFKCQTLTATQFFFAGDVIIGYVLNNDTVDHGAGIGIGIMEFDA